MRARFLLIATIPALLAGYAAHALMDYRIVPAILIAGVALMCIAELMRVLSSREF